MAESCLICGNQISALQSVKTLQGCICKKCADNIPSSLNIKSMSAVALKQMFDYESELKNSDFDVTSSYGSLLLDELNGYVILAEKTDSDEKPIGHYEIYDLSEISGIGLYATNPRSEKKDIVCDVEFALTMDTPPVKIKKTIKTAAKCTYKQVKGSQTQVEWCEPGDLSMFRNMLDQSIKAAVNRVTKDKLPSLSKHDINLFQAESSLLLKEGYTMEEVADHKNRLIHAFMDLPDGNSYKDILEYYSSLVIKELRRKEKEGSDYR